MASQNSFWFQSKSNDNLTYSSLHYQMKAHAWSRYNFVHDVTHQSVWILWLLFFSVEQRVNILAIRHMTCACVEFRKKLFKFLGLNLNFKTPSSWNHSAILLCHRQWVRAILSTRQEPPQGPCERRNRVDRGHHCRRDMGAWQRYRLSWGLQHKSVVRIKWLYKHLSALLKVCLLACLLACSYKENTKIGSEISLARDNFIIPNVWLAELRACLGGKVNRSYVSLLRNGKWTSSEHIALPRGKVKRQKHTPTHAPTYSYIKHFLSACMFTLEANSLLATLTSVSDHAAIFVEQFRRIIR